MTDTATLSARLETLKKARDSGVLQVRHGDTMTTFRSLSELESIIADLEGQISGASTPRRRIRYLFQSGKGL